MFTRLIGALVRAGFVALLIATPSLMLPGITGDGTEIVALIALFGFGLTIFEYTAAYPSLIEFRDAPPFNRIRFLSLFASVFLITVLCVNGVAPSGLTLVVEAFGRGVGEAIDFPFSPVWLMVDNLPDGPQSAVADLVRAGAGLAYAVALLTLMIFALALRVVGWPNHMQAFNVWINLPTFDPTTGGDVVARLNRDATVNIILGFLLPFMVPGIAICAALLFSPWEFSNYHTLIWSVSAWAFLPCSLFMRGMAMRRVAAMIAAKRRQSLPAAEVGFAAT